MDFSASQRLAQGGLLGSTLTTLTNMLGLTGGASYRDNGTLIERVYDRTGVRLLSLLDLQWLLGDADRAEWGVLNLLGLSNPLGSVAPNYVVWGSAAGWSNSYYVVWGSAMQSPDGEYVVWGSGDSSGEYRRLGQQHSQEKRSSDTWPHIHDIRSPQPAAPLVGAVGVSGVVVIALSIRVLSASMCRSNGSRSRC